MGLFDFVKSAGKALGFGDDEKAPTADALKSELAANGINADKLEVAVEGDKAVIKGSASDQESLEKAIVAIGNTIGIAKVETEVDVPEAREPMFHTVESGDTLWKIAETCYGKGKGSKYAAIFEANKPMLSDPDKIYPGQVLRIPEIAEA